MSFSVSVNNLRALLILYSIKNSIKVLFVWLLKYQQNEGTVM